MASWFPAQHSVSRRPLALHQAQLLLEARIYSPYPLWSTLGLICQALFYTHQHPGKCPSVTQGGGGEGEEDTPLVL